MGEEGRFPEYATDAYDRGDLFFDICCLMYINVHIRQRHVVKTYPKAYG